MNRFTWTIFIGVALACVLVIHPLITSQVIAQGENKTLAKNATSPHYTNNTRAIVDLKNHTITVIDTTTNETLSVRSFTEAAANTTTNQSLSGTAENMTANETLTTNTGNATTNVNLTDKFNALQGK